MTWLCTVETKKSIRDIGSEKKEEFGKAMVHLRISLQYYINKLVKESYK
jgi:hypothetical protein